MPQTGVGSAPSLVEAWHHSRPTLVTANMPALIIAAAGFGILSLDLAILLAQLLAVGMLGVLYSGGIGMALAVMKHLLH